MGSLGGTGARQRSALRALLLERSVRRGRFTLASGKTSDFFVDCKQTVLTAEGHRLVGELMLDALQAFGAIDAVAGVELGGCPLASAVSLTSALRGAGLDAIYVRKAVKNHGSSRAIEGNTELRAGARVVLLEDVVTTGGSTIRAAARLRDAGYEVAGVVAIVDREEGAREALADDSLALVSLFRRTELIDDAPTA